MRKFVGNANEKAVKLDSGEIISVAQYLDRTYKKKVHCFSFIFI